MYEKDGVEYVRKIGSRENVVAGSHYCTAGGLTKEQLIVRGAKIISKKRSEMGKARFEKRNPFQKEEDDEKSEPVKVKASAAVARPRVRRRRRR
jgi:hypothetical protein